MIRGAKGDKSIEWLALGGRMAERVREFDWSRTPLGPLEGWSQSLRTAVGVCLNSSFPMYIWWGPSLIHIYNDAFVSVLGQRHPGALGMSAPAVWPEVWEQVAPDVRRVLDGGESVSHKRVRFVIERNGYPEEAYFTYSQSPIPDDDGGIGGLFQVCTDETERVRSEQALRESEARLSDQKEAFELAVSGASVRDVLDVLVRAAQRRFGPHARTAIFMVDPEGQHLRLAASAGLSDAYTTAVDGFGINPSNPGCGRAAYTGQSVIVPDVMTDPPWAPYVAIARESGIRASWSFPIRSAGGQVIGAFAVYQGVVGGPGKEDVERAAILTQTAGVIIERHKAGDALRESEERLRLGLEAGGLGLWDWDMVGGRVKWSERVYALHGLTPDTFDGTVERFVRCVHAEDRERVEAAIAYAVEHCTPYEVEFRVVRPGGEVAWLTTTGKVFRGPNGMPVRMMGATGDATDRKHAADALGRAKDEAETANRAKDKFLAVLSHELRTPLTPVALTLAAMETDERLPADLRDDLAMARRNVDLETHLIDDMLDLSRVISGKLRLHLGPTCLHEVIGSVLRTVGAELNEKLLKVEAELSATRHVVDGDDARLQQVFWNLLKNAAKFTPVGGTVRVRTYDGGDGRVAVEVSDSGLGIDADSLARVFEPFEQGDAQVTRKHGGLGLGLAIAKAVIGQHGGTIRATSGGVGCGATFVISLPVTKGATGEVATLRGAGGEATRTLRLLLVEDHADTARTLARLLRRDGMEVRWAGTAAEAMEAAGAHQFDLIVSDLGLPDASGLELLRQLRAGNQDVPAIAMSGYGMDDDLRQSREAGFAEHLVKPVTVPQLRQAIRRVVGAG